MPIFHQHQLIFLHIPKTAGTSLTHWLGHQNLNHEHSNLDCLFGKHGTIQLQHLKYQQLSLFLPNEIINSYRYLIVIREPKDRLLSEYYWLKQHSFWSNYLEPQLISLEEFLKYLLSKNSLKDEFIHWHPQTEFIQGLELTSEQVYLIRFDHLIPDLEPFINKTNLKLSTNDIPKLNSSSNKRTQKLSEIEDSLLKAVIAKFYQQDVDLYNNLNV